MIKNIILLKVAGCGVAGQQVVATKVETKQVRRVSAGQPGATGATFHDNT